MNYAIFLAGGIGSRFWPLSNNSHPKQFLCVSSEKSMLEDSIGRVRTFIVDKNIYLATNTRYKTKISQCLADFNIPQKNIFFEPTAKNTFAPIAYISKLINEFDHSATVMVSPCDHFIKKTGRYLQVLNRAFNVAENGYIVTIGVNPSAPETGYGYIKVDKNNTIGYRNAYMVERFIEKPSIDKAENYVKSKNYFWNSGVFIFKPKVLLEEVKKYLPKAYKILKEMKCDRNFLRSWNSLPTISIDYALMEKTKKAAMVVADYIWKELGTWKALEEVMKKDKNGNILKGNCFDLESDNITVWSDSKPIATVGLKDIIVVNTSEACLVCSKSKTQEVKKIVEKYNLNKKIK